MCFSSLFEELALTNELGPGCLQLVGCLLVDHDDHPPLDLLVELEHAHFLVVVEERDEFGECDRSVRDESTEQRGFQFASVSLLLFSQKRRYLGLTPETTSADTPSSLRLGFRRLS